MATTPTTVRRNRVKAVTGSVPAVQEEPVEVNHLGFMTNPSEWTQGAALFLARRQGLPDWPGELASDHWRVIDFMRTYYHATGNAPSLRYTCRALGLPKKRFSRLFPGGLVTVRRIAGLPGPRKAATRYEQWLTRDWWAILTGE